MEKDSNRTAGNAIVSTTRLKQIFIIVFATVAFLMTAYATSGGARIFLTEVYAWVGVTALAVGFLAFTSLVLGDGISSHRVTQIALVLPFYLVAVVLCWISSFASYHQQFLSVGGSDLANAETNLRQMGIYAHQISQVMNDQYLDKKASLLEGDALKDYSAKMGALADDLRDRDKKREIAAELQALIEVKKVELKNRQRDLQVQENSARQDLLKLKTEVDALEGQVSERQASFTGVNDLVAKLEIALREERGEADGTEERRAFLQRDSLAGQLVEDPACQRRRRAGTGGGLPGTCYAALSNKLIESRERSLEVTKALEASQAELRTARQKAAAKQTELQKLAEQRETARLQASEGLAAGYTLDADGFLQSVNAFIDKPSQATFQQTAGYCQVVTEVLSDLKSISDLPPCEPQALMAVFRQIETLNTDQNAFNLACDEAGRRTEIIDTLRGEMLQVSGSERLKPITRAYDQMRTGVLETCLSSAEERALDTASYREDLANLYDRINPSQDPISKAIGKVEALFNGMASARDYFPALLALLQELSLLLAKLFWDANALTKTAGRKDEFDISDIDLDARPGDPEGILAAKNVILNAVYHRQGYFLPQLFDEEYSPEMRGQMRRIVDGLFRKELARKFNRGILISERGLADVARRIRRYNEELDAKNNPPAPAPAPEATALVAENENAAAETVPVAARKPADDRSEKEALVQRAAADADAPEARAEMPEQLAQRPRKRRPVVVRPSFRREL